MEPVYCEKADFYGRGGSSGGMIMLFEFSSTEDARKGYSCAYKEKVQFLEAEEITEINMFGDESTSFYDPGDDSVTLLRNGRFVVLVEAELERLDNSKENIVRYTLPEKIDAKLEQIKVPTPTPQLEKDSDGDGVPDEYDYAPYDPNVQTKSDVKTPGFGAIFAIAGVLIVFYLIRRNR